MRTFGSYLKILRKMKGFTLEVLAKKAGTNKSYLSGVENQQVAPPSPKVIRRLAEILEADKNLLISLSHAEKSPADVKDFFLEAVKGRWGKELDDRIVVTQEKG